MTTLTPTAPPALDAYAPQAETIQEFQARALRYLLAEGPGALYRLDREQLAQADAAAQMMVCRLPRELDTVSGTLNRTLADLRTRIAIELARRRDVLAQLQRKLDQTDATMPGQQLDAEQDQPEESDQARGVRLLKAALILIMGDQDQRPGGGRRAPLQPPPPTRPPQATSVPVRPPADGVQF